MKVRDNKQKIPFSRRQFLGTCAAGASMAGLAPYVGMGGLLTGCERYSPMADVSRRPKIIPRYSEGMISLTVTFPEPTTWRKKMLVKNDETGEMREEEFVLVKINKTGSLNRSGQPELPYLGVIVHIPDSFTYKVLEKKTDDGLFEVPEGLLVYPAQTRLMDNRRCFLNYEKKAEYNHEVYQSIRTGDLPIWPEYKSLEPTVLPPKYLIKVPDLRLMVSKNGPPAALLRRQEESPSDEVRERVRIRSEFYLGASRFVVLEILPVIYKSDQLYFRPEIKIDIKVVRHNYLSWVHQFDTPFLPAEYDRLPRHERIIDPWHSPDNAKRIFPDIEPYALDMYRETGPDMIIFYQQGSKDHESLYYSAKRLLLHKRQHGYPMAEMVAVQDPLHFEDNGKVREIIRQVCDMTTEPFREDIWRLWRLNSIILLGDIPGIRAVDLYSELSGQYPEDSDPADREYYSDYCLGIHGMQNDLEKHWPGIAVGRIPARTNKEAALVIDNIIDYETHSYDVHRHLTLSSYFQDKGKGSPEFDGEASRDYLQCVEEIHMNIDRSYVKAERIYQSQNPRAACRLKYRDGEELPWTIRFLDAGEAKRKIADAFRSGGRLILHRDHGWMNGWSHPNFKIPDLWKVKFDAGPGCGEAKPSIVFNINCLSGRFTGENFVNGSTDPEQETRKTAFPLPKPDNDCFSEALLRGPVMPDGTRLNLHCPAVIASTEVSPSFENDWLTKLMFDMIYGGILTGSPKTECEMGTMRIGDILNTAKILLHAYHGDRGFHLHDNVVFHILGDPTLLV